MNTAAIDLPSRLARLNGNMSACPVYAERLTRLDEFIGLCETLTQETWLWFRGHSNWEWSLTPSALRSKREDVRTRALSLIHEFKRLAVRKLVDPPPFDHEFEWTQIARHYGLPTRLLDWTQNAAVGLYFACRSNRDTDGLVYVLNPVELNLVGGIADARILDANTDAELIREYLALGGRIQSRGKPSLAVNPVWNSERLVLQKGVFTLHGSRHILIDSSQALSLMAIPVYAEDKSNLLRQLSLIGVDEMSIFPEPEYVSRFLCRVLEQGR